MAVQERRGGAARRGGAVRGCGAARAVRRCSGVVVWCGAVRCGGAVRRCGGAAMRWCGGEVRRGAPPPAAPLSADFIPTRLTMAAASDSRIMLVRV